MQHYKQTDTEHPITDLIKNRWSVRAFRDKAITKEDMNSIFEAARWAPSASNEQPWQFVFALKGSRGFETLVHDLMPGNQPWAKHAAALVVSIAVKVSTTTQKENKLALHDLGLATANLLHQALALGIYGHVMAGIDRTKLAEDLQLTEELLPVTVIALGYPGPADLLEEPYKSRETAPRARKPIGEFVKELT